MSHISEQDPLEKLTKTGFVWSKFGNGIGFTDVLTRTDSFILFVLAYNLSDTFFPEMEKKILKKYVGLRRLPDTEGKDLIGDDLSFEDGIATVSVRSISRKNWKENVSYRLSISHLKPKDAPFQERLDSFRKIVIGCQCPRGTGQSYYLHSQNQTKPSGVDAIYCAHADFAHDWLSIFHDVYGFGMHPPDTYKTIGYIVKKVVENNQKLPKYRMNLQFMPEKEDLFKPLAELKATTQISPA